MVIDLLLRLYLKPYQDAEAILVRRPAFWHREDYHNMLRSEADLPLISW